MSGTGLELPFALLSLDFEDTRSRDQEAMWQITTPLGLKRKVPIHH